jgi:putative PIG3 family NAD(P)H quinone oxidoreductase
MQAIVQDHPGEPETLHLGEVPRPPCGPGEVRIAVHSTAVNRADVLQRRGQYQLPAGTTPILGLEAAGVISEVGADVVPASGLHVGQRVMALLAGGGYAEEVAVPSGQVMPIPDGMSDEEAAAIPEVFLTAYLNLFCLGGLRLPDDEAAAGAGASAGKSVLIHGGASGVGTAALQLGRAAGAIAYCTVGADERARSCRELGAAAAFNYHSVDFLPAVLSATDQRGVDIVLDPIGASYLARNLRVLATDGRLILIGLMGGKRAELDMDLVLARRIRIIGSMLRPLPPARKAALVRAFAQKVLPRFARRELRPIVDQVLPLAQAAEAHRALDQHHVGKIVLRVR